MKAYQKALWVVAMAALGAFSLAGVLVNVGIISRMTAYLALGRMWLDVLVRVPATLVFLFLLYLAGYLPIATWLRKKARALTISNPQGRIEIPAETVSKFLRTVGERVPEVEDVKVEVKTTDEGVECKTTLTVYAHTEGGIPRITEDVQHVLKKYLTDTVGIPDVKSVQVRVARILEKPEVEK